MKKTYKLILASAIALFGFTACSDWTDTEIKDGADLVNANKTAAYYQSLRDYKASDHQKSFGWFGNWTGTGVSLENSLRGLPDSVDFVSLWGGWRNPSDAMLKDLRLVQNQKGTKALVCFLVFDIGDQMTPEVPEGENMSYKEWRHKFWGWGNDEASQLAATAKYANAICDTIDKYGYDGFDIDAEPSYAQPFETDRELWKNPKVMQTFVETLAKRIGPKSGTGRMLVVDGEPDAFDAKYADYFDYFILQAYAGYSDNSLDYRFNRQADHFKEFLTPEQVAKKIIVCENFESYAKTGGVDFYMEDGTVVPSLLGFAHWAPKYDGKKMTKGGVGTFHMEYEYNIAGASSPYPFMRQAIQIMNPAKIHSLIKH